MNLIGLISLLLPAVTSALFTRGDGVVELSSNNIDQITDSTDLWIVKFFAPWCGHCQSLAPEWTKVAKALKGVVKVAALDVDQNPQLGKRFGIQGYPTIKIFAQNKNNPIDYDGARSAQAIVDATLSHLQAMIRSRLNGGGQQSYSSSDDSDDGGSVVELTDSNFQEKLAQKEGPWLVEFFAPWCGHCKSLKPHWDKAAKELKGKVNLAALDATVHKGMASRYEVRGFPTIKFFASGKNIDNPTEYDGGRSSDDIVRWALDKLADSIPPPKIVELTEQAQLTEGCEGHQLCVISILPHILDSQSEQRNKYLETLGKLGKVYKKNMWGWIWVEAGAQPKLEEMLGIGGFGYPAMAALNARKMAFAPLRGPFTYEGIEEFLRALAYGRGRTETTRSKEMPKITKTTPWDGRDAVPPGGDDIDLSELGLDLGKKEEL